MSPPTAPRRTGWVVFAMLAAVVTSVPGNCAFAVESVVAAKAVVAQPRPFGHVLGDVLEQRVLLQIDGRDVEPAALPRAARLGVWLERLGAEIVQSDDGRRWLIVAYQIINAPQALTTVRLPAWEIKSKSGAETLQIAAWPLTVVPLTPRNVVGEGGLEDLLPDHAPPLLEAEPIRRKLWLLASLAGLSLVAWLAWFWWRNRRAAADQPFARALRELRGSATDSPQSWQILHRAFDAAAGRVIRNGTLESLFERAPHLEVLRPQIEQFYAQSAQLFFSAAQPDTPFPLLAFCRALRRLEKRHER